MEEEHIVTAVGRYLSVSQNCPSSFHGGVEGTVLRNFQMIGGLFGDCHEVSPAVSRGAGAVEVLLDQVS